MMLQLVRIGIVTGAAVATAAGYLVAQSGASMPPVNQAPNPYQTVENYFKLPAGRTWGSTSAVDIDKDGRTIWVAERCGANSCLNSTLDTVLKFDASGTLVKSFGAGLMVFPHGIHVDRDGNIWVTDGQDNRPRPARGAPPDAPLPPAPEKIIGHQVFKFSPDGKLLMTLGKPGGSQTEKDSFYQPNDVLVAPSGDIFVAEGHGGNNARIVKFKGDGTFIKEIGKKGTGPVEFDQPHALAMDSKGRLYVGDRSNNRIQILDQDGKFISETAEFGRPSGIWIDKNDVLYVADSESGSVNPNRPEWRRGIRIGKLSDSKVTAFIPDPEARNAPEFRGTSAAEGVAVDAAGNIYGAEVGPKAVKKYTKK
jgi:sugar lactone lactonase YvrE